MEPGKAEPGEAPSVPPMAPASRYRGRFAPSPTGPLHLGSLVAAVGSWLIARRNQGDWLLRIEDIDPPREIAGAAARQIETLAAFGMQSEAPEAFDLSKETDATHKLYGLPRGGTRGFAWQCLVARRLAERGVRFIELIDTGASGNWDSHGDMNQHGPLAKNVDQPIAGLLRDLKSRGMLAETLVVWTTEFGRTPFNTGKDAKGREHHAEVFTSWMAGGGVRGGFSYGESDDYGCAVATNEVHIHDFHATILHLLGLDHEKLTYRHAGRDFRLTDVAGRVVREIIA